MTKRVSEKPKIVNGEFLGLSQPQVLDSSTPNTNRPRPEADRTEPTTSSFGTGVGPGASFTLRVMNKMKAAMKTSPTNTTRHGTAVAQPPTMGPTAYPCAGDAADHRAGGFALGAFEVPGDERGEGGDEAGTDAFEDRPSQREDGDLLRCGG